MKIEIKEDKKVTFDTLRLGQTFLDPEYEERAVLMVVEPAIDINLSTDREDDAIYAGYAVDLSNGVIMGYGSAEEVVPVDTTLTARRI